MKIFTCFFSVILALAVNISNLQAQNSPETKTQAMGLITFGILQPALQIVTNDNFRTTLLEEGFDTDWLPAGWMVINTHPTNNWEQNNPDPSAPDFSTIDPNSLYSALVPWINEDQDEWLISPEIDAGGETPLNLTWYAGVSGPWLTSATLKCLISTDGGTTWTELWNAVDEIDPNADWGWNLVGINLDDYASTPFKIAWEYVGNDGDLACVDGVKVNAGYNYLYQTNFEDYYQAGDMVALDDTTGFWTTWSNEPGGSEDAPVVNTQSSSSPNSAEVMGITDLILLLGNKTSGKYMVNFKYYILSGNGAYFNFQHFEEPGIPDIGWAFEVYFGATGDGYMHAGMANAANFSYAHDTWLQLSTVVDLDNDSAWFYIDNNLIYNWPFHYSATDTAGILQLGGVDFYAGAPTGETPHYFLDDVEFIELVPGITTPIIDVDPTSLVFLLENWETTDQTLSVGNTGQEDLNFQIVPIYPQGTKALSKTPAGIHPMVPKEMNTLVAKAPQVMPSTNNPSDREVVLHYDGDNFSAIGNPNADYEWRVAAMFPSDMLTPYIGMELYQVELYLNDPPLATKIQVYGMGSYNPVQPGDLLLEQDFTGVSTSWNTVTLDNPLYIDGQDLWVGYWLQGAKGTFVPGVDGGPHDPNGDWIAFGPGWGHLYSPPDLDYNWNIRAHLQGEPIVTWLSVDPVTGTLMENEYTDVTVTVDATNLDAPAQYNAELIVRSNDPDNPSVVVGVTANVIVGIDENGNEVKDYVFAFPNPANETLNVKTNGTMNHIRLLNSIGQMVYDSKLNGNEARINISDLNTGVYFLQVETDHGVSTQKIIVE